jgi:hypothetical protein
VSQGPARLPLPLSGRHEASVFLYAFDLIELSGELASVLIKAVRPALNEMTAR